MRQSLGDLRLLQAVVHADIDMTRQLRDLAGRYQRS